MLRFINRLSLALALVATVSIIVNRPSTIQAQGPMGSYAMWSDWDTALNYDLVVGFASAFQTAAGSCDHWNYEFTATLYSPTRNAQILEYGNTTTVGLPFDGEFGDWGLYSSIMMHCSCGGSWSGGSFFLAIPLRTIPHYPDPVKLVQCQNACQAGGIQSENFCRNISLPDPKATAAARLMCWSARALGTVACMGMCYEIFGDW
jgi:hypothetical protein